MVKLNNKSNKILIDYYEGAYGPTIRIDTQSTKAIERVKKIFWELALAQTFERNLYNDEYLEITGIKLLTLRLVTESNEKRKTLNLLQLTSQGPIFHWSKSSEGWKDCIDLIDGILKYNYPSHQYLTDENIDDALVEITYLEER